MGAKTLALFGVAALTIAACGPAPRAAPVVNDAAGQPRFGGVLKVEVNPDPFNWDITISKTNPNDNAIALANNSLLGFKFGPETGYTEMVLRPELAERWEISPDARTYTFHLRKGATFHNLPPVNGREVTATDFKFAAEYRLRDGEFKDKKLPKAEIDYIFEGLQRVETPDNYTVVYHFKAPYVPFIHYAASDWNPVLPREIYDQDGHFQDTLIGTGPYILDTAGSQKGTRWVFKKNQEYWDRGKPYLDEIRWLVLPQEAMAYAAFQTGQLDLLESGIDHEDAQTVRKGSPGAVESKWMEPRATQIYLSQKPERNSPVRDLRVRRAISLAIDRDEINRALFGGAGEWGLPGAVHGLFTEAEVKQIYKHDVAEARRLVTEAGYGNGVSLEWPIPNDEDQTNVTLIELIQAQLKKAGMNLTITTMDKASQRLVRRASDFDLDAGFGLGGLHDDADSLYMARYHSKSKGNYSYVRDPQMDKMLEASRAEADLEKRRELLRSISRYVAEHHYTIELVYRPKWAFWHPYVKNFRTHWGSQAPYAMAWLEK